ncbi:Cleavage and polyadenylation specificity factor subunit 1 [Labeo rohita]|uniref:Cleavage and polyadenylation specificity factor subunit 1 n=1 Tax=Labeo rohita TaxID=84645 RepID=A0ABQ8LPJ0_LABRO|nr:Cleavage and polyadenylation specificity factor subunit 1 [Labeo rohita]
MYAVYRQAHPPTAVEFAVYCNFISSQEKNLVVAGTSQLYVYRIIYDVESTSKTEKASDGKSRKEKLEQVASFSLFGNVMSMASVQLVGTNRDALLLSFKDAKLSVVEYDPGTHDLKTLSLHYFEEPELRDGFVQNMHIPMVRVDPENRCAVMLVYGTQLVVLPFRKDTLTDEQEGIVGEGYIIDVRELDEKLLNIIDMKFLHGYYEPTLLILFEPNQTWPGRVAVRQDTCSIVAISLNIMQKVHPVIWSLSNLPFDCTQVMAVPKPIGPQDEVKITLDCSQASFISSDKVVISLKGGEIYVLTLITDGMRSVRAFHFDKAAASVLTTCMTTMEAGYLFLGSRLGNSLLLRRSLRIRRSVWIPWLTGQFQTNPEPDLEVVVCSGFGKNGALSVLQKSIRPQVVTTFELPGCHDMWTVIYCEEKPEKSPPEGESEGPEEEKHEPTVEDDKNKHGFLILSREDSTMGPTVYAGNIGDNKYIIQVSPMGIRLLEGVNQLHFIPVDLGSPIVHCSVADPYVVIMTAEGVVTMFQSRVITLCAYRDVSGMFTTENKISFLTKEETAIRTQSETETIIHDISNTVDDEEEMLYGESNPLTSPSKEEPSRTSAAVNSAQTGREGGQSRQEPSHWCLLVRENGVMEIYQLPDWRLVFLVKNFPVGQRVLVDSSASQSATQGELKKEEVTRQGEIPLVKEVALVSLGYNHSRPYLLAHVDQELLIYEAFPYDQQQAQSNLKVRFKKMPHNINFREKKTKMRKDKKPEGQGEETLGVFICGPSPHWMLVTSRGAMRLHPMTIDGAIESFSPFHNINCPKGFLYFNKQGELRISVLPTYLSYDAPWPVRKIPLRCTVHYVSYHVESKVYAVCSSVKEQCTRIPRMTGEEKEYETIERDERYIHPQQENQETVSGLKGYVAVGTCLMQGEEVTCRGRILILDVIEVVPEPGQPLTKNKFKVLYEKEQKGPVTALCHCSGYLVSAIGQKIFLWSLKDNDLTGMAFIDTQLYIHQMYSIKNFILAADVMKSISLLRYQEESKTLSLVSRDAKPLEVYSIEFMVDNNQLGFLVSDRDKNLLVYMYLPEAKESFGGMRLLRRADFNVGAHVNAFWRMPCRGTLDLASKKSLTWDNKHITWFATLDGGVGLLLPMQEKTYRRLLMLQNALTTMLPHHAGLNPKAFSTMERSELAKKIGTTADIILDDLLEIDRNKHADTPMLCVVILYFGHRSFSVCRYNLSTAAERHNYRGAVFSHFPYQKHYNP